ncbi:MAG TPA: Nif3-like dinuclear metal center hexameric protein [Cytophagaceae bacterium]|jgi:dinuclear metal center YbgI/SA1388 family protein
MSAEPKIYVRDIAQELESLAPKSYQEDYDNCGLLLGSHNSEVSGILFTLDVTIDVIEEAIKENCNLVIAHHPLIFKGLKKITGSNEVEKCVIMAIKNDIAIYAIHTNLDNVSKGVNYKIGEKLGMKNMKILSPKNHLLKKLVVFVPIKAVENVTKALFATGAGNIGNYSECSFQVEGVGTFRPDINANPSIGEALKLENVEEKRVEIIYPLHLETKVLKALHQSHPYEEPAFDLIEISNATEVGAGMIGELDNKMDETEFLQHLKDRLNLNLIRHTKLLGRRVKKIAWCGGTGSFLLSTAIRQNADIFISSDFKYHEFFQAEQNIVIADINHYEAEVFTKELLYEYLMKKFCNIALVLSKVNSNPIGYL